MLFIRNRHLSFLDKLSQRVMDQGRVATESLTSSAVAVGDAVAEEAWAISQAASSSPLSQSCGQVRWRVLLQYMSAPLLQKFRAVRRLRSEFRRLTAAARKFVERSFRVVIGPVVPQPLIV